MKKNGLFLGLLLFIGVFFSCNHEIEDVAKYTVTYQSEYGTVPSLIVVNDNTALTQEQLPILEEEGYVFDGWYIGDTKIEAGYKVNSNIILFARWKPNTDTIYKVKHYQQNINDDEYTLVETEEKSGTTGAVTKATAKEYEGFVAKTITQGIILADGSTETKVYYDRKVITLTFDSDGGSEVESITGKYGADVTVPNNPTKEGYSFVEWSPAVPKTMPKENVTCKAKWATNTDTIYKVKHYQQNINDDEYTLVETEEKSGTTGAVTKATAKEYEGFVAKTITQVIILADGSTETKVYYDRKVITLTFDSDGGSEVESITGKYGATITTPENPTREGYSFEGWNSELPETMPKENVTYKAKWVENSLGIIVQTPVLSDIPNLSEPIVSGSTIIFMAPEVYKNYSWYIDGILQENANSQILVINTTDFSVKSYCVMLVVTDENGNIYSAQYELEVTK